MHFSGSLKKSLRHIRSALFCSFVVLPLSLLCDDNDDAPAFLAFFHSLFTRSSGAEERWRIERGKQEEDEEQSFSTSSDAKNMFKCIEQTFRMLRLTLTLFIFHKSSLILFLSSSLPPSSSSVGFDGSISPQGPPLWSWVCWHSSLVAVLTSKNWNHHRSEIWGSWYAKNKKCMTAIFFPPFFDAGRVTFFSYTYIFFSAAMHSRQLLQSERDWEKWMVWRVHQPLMKCKCMRSGHGWGESDSALSFCSAEWKEKTRTNYLHMHACTQMLLSFNFFNENWVFFRFLLPSLLVQRLVAIFAMCKEEDCQQNIHISSEGIGASADDYQQQQIVLFS